MAEKRMPKRGEIWTCKACSPAGIEVLHVEHQIVFGLWDWPTQPKRDGCGMVIDLSRFLYGFVPPPHKRREVWGVYKEGNLILCHDSQNAAEKHLSDMRYQGEIIRFVEHDG